MSKVIIQTERLVLREFSSGDAFHFYQLNADPEVLRYTGDRPFINLAEARTFLQNYDAYKKHGMGRWAVLNKADHVWLGWCGLKYHEDMDRVDLGFRFFRLHWVKGYATEAGEKLLHFAFANLELPKVVSVALADNQASTRVMEKLGLTFDHRGRYYDTECVFYQITYQEWKEIHASEQSNSKW